MNKFQGKIAVITGGASGIGFAFAQKAAQLGMNLVIADIEPDTMDKASAQLREFGVEVLTVKTDVSDHKQVEALAEKAFTTFGTVHLLFNNAGVAAGSSVWETTNADWDWVLGVNLKGVINGVRAFVPRMLENGEEGHIINTASVGGLVSYHPGSTYHVTKHAVVALSENMYHMMNLKNTKINISVLCPGWVRTRILDATRNRPEDAEASPEAEEERIVRESFARAVEKGMTPEEIAEATFKAIQKKQFYIIPDQTWLPAIRSRMEDILAMRNPRTKEVFSGFLNDPKAIAELAKLTVKEKVGQLFKRKK